MKLLLIAVQYYLSNKKFDKKINRIIEFFKYSEIHVVIKKIDIRNNNEEFYDSKIENKNDKYRFFDMSAYREGLLNENEFDIYLPAYAVD